MMWSPYKECPQCASIFSSGLDACPVCGEWVW